MFAGSSGRFPLETLVMKATELKTYKLEQWVGWMFLTPPPLIEALAEKNCDMHQELN